MAQEAGQVYTGFWWGRLTERDHLEDLRVDGKIILKYLFKKQWRVDWADLLRTATSGGLL